MLWCCVCWLDSVSITDKQRENRHLCCCARSHVPRCRMSRLLRPWRSWCRVRSPAAPPRGRSRWSWTALASWAASSPTSLRTRTGEDSSGQRCLALAGPGWVGTGRENLGPLITINTFYRTVLLWMQDDQFDELQKHGVLIWCSVLWGIMKALRY